MEMTPRERFWKTCRFEEPDRVPIHLSGLTASIAPVRDGFGPYGYDAVCRYLNITDYEEPIGDFATVNLHPKIKQRCHNDFESVIIGGPDRIKLENYEINQGQHHKMWGFYSIMCHGAIEYPESMSPLLNKNSLKDIEEYEFWPDPDDPVFYEGVREKAKKLYEDTQYIVVGDSGLAATIDFTYHWLRGFNNYLSDPYTCPDFYNALKKKITDISIEISKRFYEEVGPFIDMTSYYADMGIQLSAYFSVDYYRKWIMPWQKKWNDAIRPLTKAKRFIHSCGSIYELMPSIIEAGFEIINPIQPLAKNMEPWRLKKEFKGKVVLHGGIDLQKLLRSNNVDEVVKGVKELIKVLAPGGGWIAAAANNIPQDIPPENICAAFDTVYKYGKYPINL